jgi:hypothetical protein
MPYENEIGNLKEPIEKTLERTLAFAKMGTQDGILQKPLMVLAAKCTIDLIEGLARTSAEIRSFNASTGALTEQIIQLNKRLTRATWIGACATVLVAIATAIGAAATVILACKALL